MKGRAIQFNDNVISSSEILDVKVNPVRDAAGKIVQGIVVGNTTEQNKALILLARPGELKFNPDAGVGIEDLLLGNDYLEYRSKIREHLAKDSYAVSTLELYENQPILILGDYDN